MYRAAHEGARNQWVPYYIGQTNSFADRIPNHENWSAAVRLGATHVHARVESQAATRDRIKAALIAAYQPALNVQLKQPETGNLAPGKSSIGLPGAFLRHPKILFSRFLM